MSKLKNGLTLYMVIEKYVTGRNYRRQLGNIKKKCHVQIENNWGTQLKKLGRKPQLKLIKNQ